MLPSIDIQLPLIIVCCCFMVLDIVTGFVGAVVNNCVDSKKMKAGLWHKCGFMLAILFGILCEWASSFVDLGFSLPIQTAVCGFIICIEIVSNLENLCKISPELASKKFVKIFASQKIDEVVGGNDDAESR